VGGEEQLGVKRRQRNTTHYLPILPLFQYKATPRDPNFPRTQRESPKVRGFAELFAGHIEQAERGAIRKSPQAHKILPTSTHGNGFELEFELMQPHMAQKPLLWVKVGAHAVRNRSKCGGVVWAGAGEAWRLGVCVVFEVLWAVWFCVMRLVLVQASISSSNPRTQRAASFKFQPAGFSS
jgi:hypothetical protein